MQFPKNILLGIFILLNLTGIYAQDSPDQRISEKFQQTIEGIKSAIPNKGDIYGFSIGIKVSYLAAGDTVSNLYPELKHTALLQQARAFSSEERFDRYNLDSDEETIRKQGMFVYCNGISPMINTDKPDEWKVYGNEYTEKVNINGKFTKLIIHTYGIVMVQKPNDGSIGADVYYYDKSGKPQLWSGWGSKAPWISYTRMGPGNDAHNSQVGKDEFRMLNGSYISIADIFTPGHYLPVVKFRGCTQDFRDENDAHTLGMEAVLKLEKSVIDWSDARNYTIAGKTAFTSLKTSSVKVKNLLSYYSKGNIVNGHILNSNNEPITAEMDVVLKPEFSPAPFDEKITKSNLEGYFEFDEIESGVYRLYSRKHEDQWIKVEVCNCPQKGESYNQTFNQDIKIQSGYDVTARYYCNDFAEAEVIWKNVKILIPNDKSKVKIIDASAFEIDENMKVSVPYAVKIPGYGIEYFFSECANETETPEEVKMTSFKGGVCYIDKSDDALNSLSIEMTPENPNVLKLLMQFDMYIGESRENSHQMTVGTDSEYPGGTEFYWEKLDDDIVSKLQAGEYAQKILTNSGGCKLTITFKPN